MYKLAVLFISCFSITLGYSQNTSPWPSTGNVGIGTTNTTGATLTVVDGGLSTNTTLKLNTRFTFSGDGVLKWGSGADFGLLSWDAATAFMGAQENRDLALFSNGVEKIRVATSGNVGIGTNNPTAKLDVKGTANFSTASGNYTISAGGSGDDYGSIGYNLQFGNTSGAYTYKVPDYASFLKFFLGGFDFVTAPSGNPGANMSYSTPMRITKDGNVGIGTLNPDSKLTVNGTVHSKSMVVDMNIFADEVFHPKYVLPTLSYLDAYVKKHGHLPEMPSEKEVIEKGLDIGEMNKLLVKKVEELTLYLIAKDKELKQQRTINERQRNNNRTQDKRLQQLEKKLSQSVR